MEIRLTSSGRSSQALVDSWLSLFSDWSRTPDLTSNAFACWLKTRWKKGPFVMRAHRRHCKMSVSFACVFSLFCVIVCSRLSSFVFLFFLFSFALILFSLFYLVFLGFSCFSCFFLFFIFVFSCLFFFKKILFFSFFFFFFFFFISLVLFLSCFFSLVFFSLFFLCFFLLFSSLVLFLFFFSLLFFLSLFSSLLCFFSLVFALSLLFVFSLSRQCEDLVSPPPRPLGERRAGEWGIFRKNGWSGEVPSRAPR